ncbi:MAG: ribosomal protein S18-alanine N-acetyltransferase [Gallionella sp.]|jgi:ribosomal-protein-alanine N-acetyltransferase
MTLSDVDDVLAIELSVQAYPWTRGNFVDALNSGYLAYVDEAAGELRGFSVLMPGVDEAELLNIGVAASHQRKGLGREMLAAMQDEAAQRRLFRVFLEVRASNLAAIALYCRAGFSEVGLRRGYYGHGSEDALVMACDIPSPLTPDGTTSQSTKPASVQVAGYLPQVGEGDESVEGINSSSLPQAGERLGEREYG